MEERYLLTCTRYVALNPVRAGLVKKPEDWPWMSKATRYTQEMIEACTRKGYWDNHTLYEYWDKNARAYPGKAAGLVICKEFAGFNYLDMIEEIRPHIPRIRHVFIIGETWENGDVH